MSKIYEALLRAEMDRVASIASRPDSSSPVASLPDTQTGLRLEIARPTPPTPPSMEAQPSSSATALATAPAFDFEQTRRVAWKPSLTQLPSVEERGSAVEQFRSLRSRMREFRDLNPLKSLLVSSGLPQEGKSFVAANLAISFARHKSGRVLLIDGDMRRASLHKLFGAPVEPGLTEYLSGAATLAEVTQRMAPNADGSPLPAGLASLTFIPGGGDAENAADLSGSPRFQELIKLASPYFDWIVVDSSPVNLVADGVNLARSCDGVLLITRGGVTRYETAQRALQELRAAKVLGCVLNAVPNPPTTGGYYGYDNYDKVTE